MRVAVVIPVLDEERVLRDSVDTLVGFTRQNLSGHEFEMLIADNGSTDATPILGRELENLHDEVRYMHIPARGKGLAIRTAWDSVEADAYVFMDVDLSTDLEALPRLLSEIESGADIVMGSRFHPESSVSRSRIRHLLSHGYRLWLKFVLRPDFSDAPCGFKAVTPEIVRTVMNAVKDDGWFFDTELLVRGEDAGFSVAEIPVRWSDVTDEERQSKVKVVGLIWDYMRETLRLRRDLGRR
ncbi:glycosyltransferase [Patescibacteria group bacterium]